MKVLNNNLSPDTLKKINKNELDALAQEIRDLIIQTVSTNGGHLASNLGIVEITLALHATFNMPEDKIIWDVGHQCYAHKIITGRMAKFSTLRQYGGISGFPKSCESPCDSFDAGHSGTSISAALGMAVQRDLLGFSHKVIAVIGDASLTNGMALEAMNHAGYLGTDLIIILNDNEKSISKNVGAYSRYLSNLRMELMYRHTKQHEKKVMQLSKINKRASDGPLRQLKERIKHILTPSRTGAVFQELGFMYLGPLDGHDTDLLCKVFESVKDLKGPILIHAVTYKGKGYKYAEEDSTKFHGIGPFNHTNGQVEKKAKNLSYTDIYGKTIVNMARNDERIVAITAAMTDGTGLGEFKKEFPSRFFDVGISEEHAVTFAAGLAKEGAKPIVTIYSTFLQRAYDQILHDVCLQNLPVKFMIDRGGIVGEDGPTHQGVFDLSYLRSMPNMVIMAPKDENEFRHMIRTAVEYNDGPIAVRYPRGEALGSAQDPELKVLPIGESEVLQKGKTAAVLAIGSTVFHSLEAARILKNRGLNITLVNARFCKPLDCKMIEKMAHDHAVLITIEENVLAGGFGSAVVEYLLDHDFHDVKVKRIGLPDAFIEHGSQSILRENYGLSPEKMADVIENFVKKNTSDEASSKSYASR
jgi:1-deoxy-D-xylulose-5-phosphate synthase